MLLAAGHLSQALGDIDRRAVGRIRPGHLGMEVTDHFPAREAALEGRRILLA
jgi:hypothetical protein